VRGEEPVVVEALRVWTLLNGSYNPLLEFLRMYRVTVKLVVNELWV